MRQVNLSPRTWRLGTTLAVSVVLLFGFLLSIALLTYNAMLRERRASEVESAVVVARNMAAQVDRLLADIEGTTFTAALFLGGTSALDQRRTGAYLKSLQDQYDILRAVFITDLTGTVIASAEGEGVGSSLARRPYIVTLRQGARTVWSDGLVGLQTGEVTVAFGRPIYGTDGTPRAFLIAAFYPLRVTARLQASLPRDAEVTLFDQRGFILSTTYPVRLTPEQRGGRPVEAVRQARIPAVCAYASPRCPPRCRSSGTLCAAGWGNPECLSARSSRSAWRRARHSPMRSSTPTPPPTPPSKSTPASRTETWRCACRIGGSGARRAGCTAAGGWD
jgi:hypothetical protein